MALRESQILPAGPGPAGPVTVEPAQQGGEIPPAIAKNPVVLAVLMGSIPGVHARPLYYPKLVELAGMVKEIQDLGLDFVPASDGGTVLYNPAKIAPEELQAADEQGKLGDVVPDYEQLSGESPEAPPKGAQGFEGADKVLSKVQGSPRLATQAPVGKASVATQAQLQAARLQNILPSGPVSGTIPVSGPTSRALAKNAF
jgi:hypothetical protein